MYLGDGGPIQSLHDLPFYFGNTVVLDFLNLKENEWQMPYIGDSPCLKKEYHVLSVGCGDIRSLINTIAMLPEGFTGKLNVTLCDFDPFVMARNVLLLYMIITFADEPDFKETFTSIWYSLQLSEHDYQLLDKALETLCTISEQSLHQLTNGLLDMPSEEVGVLRQAWIKWHKMECTVDHPDSVELYEQRRKILGDFMCNPFQNQGVGHMESFEKWWEDGIFAPSVTYRDQLPFYNPIMTGRSGTDRTIPDEDEGDEVIYPDSKKLAVKKEPKDFDFVYCIHGSASPFTVWDYVKTEQIDLASSITVQHHKFISNKVGKAISYFQKENGASVHLTIAEFHDLTEDSGKFDRIFLSNLTAFNELHHLVSFFGPLLSRENKYATIVMEEMNADVVSDPDGLVSEEDFRDEVARRKKLCLQDDVDFGVITSTGLSNMNSYHDYGYDAEWYVRYLKARYKHEFHKVDDMTIPSCKTVMNCGDLRMRDVRKERNRLVPFVHRDRKNKGGVPARLRRAFEWIIAQTE